MFDEDGLTQEEEEEFNRIVNTPLGDELTEEEQEDLDEFNTTHAAFTDEDYS